MELSKREFFKTMLDKGVRDEVMTGAVMGYVCFGFSLLASLVLRFAFDDAGNPYMVIDLAVFLLMAAGIQLLQSRACAVILLVYYLIGQGLLVYTQIQEGAFHMISGRVVFIFIFANAFVKSVKGTFRFHEAWKQYQAGEYVPKPIPSSGKKALK